MDNMIRHNMAVTERSAAFDDNSWLSHCPCLRRVIVLMLEESLIAPMFSSTSTSTITTQTWVMASPTLVPGTIKCILMLCIVIFPVDTPEKAC